jgi:hypothetical protein
MMVWSGCYVLYIYLAGNGGWNLWYIHMAKVHDDDDQGAMGRASERAS